MMMMMIMIMMDSAIVAGRYMGYGMLGGAGWGLGYISPVSTMMKWFPDRRGLAAGLGLTAFGGGAMIAAPLNEHLFEYFRVRFMFVLDFSQLCC